MGFFSLENPPTFELKVQSPSSPCFKASYLILDFILENWEVKQTKCWMDEVLLYIKYTKLNIIGHLNRHEFWVVNFFTFRKQMNNFKQQYERSIVMVQKSFLWEVRNQLLLETLEEWSILIFWRMILKPREMKQFFTSWGSHRSSSRIWSFDS